MITLLSSCATRQDNGPATEVKGICRSCKPYKVRGSWYTPQLHYRYNTVGIASWYGPGFHGKQKACGETYDQNEISAAHKTLPLPTVVRVTNMKTGKEVDLVVDDRGPYNYGREIDLSVAAAKKIGVHSKGTANVRVRGLQGHSQALALYLARNGNKSGVVSGRRWADIYREEIVGKYPEDSSSSDIPTPPHNHKHGTHEVIEQFIPSPVPDAPTKGKSVGYGNINNLLDGRLPATVGKLKPVVGSILTATAQRPQTYKALPGGVVQPQSSPRPLVKAPSHYIELAAFANFSNAAEHLREVSALSPASIKETVVGQGQRFYVVRCGPYASQKDAQSALSALDMLGHNPKLVKE